MGVESKTIVRSLFVALLVISATPIVEGYLSTQSPSDRSAAYEEGSEMRAYGSATDGESKVVAPRPNVTVITTSERIVDGERANFLVAFSPDGRVLYYNDSHRVYNDVDPVANTTATVMYVAADHLTRSECDATTDCWRNVVETVNMTTGEVTRLYSYTTSVRRGQWHDADRINATHIVVADIALDSAFVVNTSSGIVEWEWNAQSEYPLSGGGLFPGDWTHINDVEVLEDGRIMVSLRNQDQVVFIDRQTGVVENWTLGEEDNHSILYEQHNPDYIPPERGGPAVLVADSENNRIVEYQRTPSGTWREAWTWQDVTLQWPRDADRLPNGHTLITDSNGGRVLEVNRAGEIVWTVDVEGAYDAERFESGDESTDGKSATAFGLASADRAGDGRTEAAEQQPSASQSLERRLLLGLKERFPEMVLNPILYVLPSWIDFLELMALLFFGTTAIIWMITEFYWSAWSFRLTRRQRES